MTKLEQKFLAMWLALGGPGLKGEYMFHVERNWRFDFAHPATRTAFEIQGGIYTGGAHARVRGLERDYEKLNTAQMFGWSVFQLSRNMITRGRVRGMVEHVKAKQLLVASC